MAAILLGPAAYPVTRIARGSQVLPLFARRFRRSLRGVAPVHSHVRPDILRDSMSGRNFLRHIHTSPAGCPAAPQEVGVHTRPACALTISCSLYALCALAGVTAVTLVLEAWNMMTDIVGAASPAVAAAQWKAAGLGAVAGMTVGILMAVILGILAAMRGREFCTSVCPLGTAFGMLSEYAIYHIEINPDKCTSCGQCEENAAQAASRQ